MAKIYGWQAFKPGYYPDQGKTLLLYGIKNFIGTLAGQVEAQISKFILGFLSTAQAIAAFNIPQNITMKAAGVVSQFSQAFFPLSASLIEKDRIQKLRNLYLGLQTLIIFGGVLAIFLAHYFGEGFLLWWLRDSVIVGYAYPVLKVMSYYFVLVALTPLPTALVQGIGYPQLASLFAVITVVLETVLLVTLVPAYHEIGASYAFLISSAISVPLFLISSWLLFLRTVNNVSKS
jgi:O-antigen/teichoic acid export membrane protein